MPSPSAKPRTIDEILAGVNAGQWTVLQKLRQAIRKAAPGATECISYGLAAFRLNGRLLVAFGAWTNHCALYPMSSATAASFEDELKNFETSKGTIRFTTDQPLPAALVKKLVQARIAENKTKGNASKKTSRLSQCELLASPRRRADALRRTVSIQPNFPPGLAQPGLRALAAAGLTRLADLAKVRETDLMKFHGMSPKAMAVLRTGLKERGKSFKS